MATPSHRASVEAFDEMVTPASKKGQQEIDDTLEIYGPADFAIEKARRTSTAKDDVNFLYCLVFQAEEQKPSGMVNDIKSKFVETKYTEQQELDESRIDILEAIEDAGFSVECVFSSTRDNIIVKIGCNDDRLLKEAELMEYKLELNAKSLQHVLELKIKDINPDAEVDKPTHPVYMGYNNYTKEEFEKIQAQGGENALPIFRNREFLTSELTDHPISLETAKKTFLSQCSSDPFKYMHFLYDSDWEEKVINEHNVQLYKSYLDGGILRTVDRIFIVQNALTRERSKRNGYRGAGLNLKDLQFKKKIKGYYPIQFGPQIRKAKDLSAIQIYDKFKYNTGLGFRMFLPFSQPVQDMRDYCGEKIAYYFAFLEFYSLWLVFSAFLGLIVWFVQFSKVSKVEGANIFTTPAVIEIINVPDGLTPEEVLLAQDFASERTPFALSDDNSTLVALNSPTEIPYLIAVYAVIIAFWAAFFLEFWKRRQATLAFKWGVSDYENTAQVRPEFSSSYDVPDAVTGLPTPYRSSLNFALRLTMSFSLVGTFVVMTVAAFAATYIFKAFMAQSDSLDPAVAVQVALVLNGVGIYVLGSVFKSIGKKLTDAENHRTDIEYEDQLIGKIFIFTFFNSYTTLIYFAFVKSGTELIGQNQYCVAELEDFEKPAEDEDFDPELSNQNFTVDDLFAIDSCYGALGYSLIIIFATQILMNNFQEIGIPMLKNVLKKYFNTKKIRDRTRAIGERVGDGIKEVGDKIVGGHKEEKAQDDDEEVIPLKSPAETQFLLNPYTTPFHDYLELALQFGYVTLFVAAFPLAPVLALVNNFIEVWVDSSKICLLSRRPNVQRAQDIGTWHKIFEVLSYIAIVTNAGVLVFTSPDLVPLKVQSNGDESNKVWAFLAFILGVFAVKYITDFFISDTPTRITVMLRRQQHFQQKIFFDTEDDTEKMVVMIDNSKRHRKKPKGEGEEGDEDDERALELLQRYEPLPSDPFMDDIVTEVREKMITGGVTQDKLFAAIDTNNSGTINLRELKRALLREDIGLGTAIEEPVIALFVSALDLDGDGTISRTELSVFLGEDGAQVPVAETV